MSTNILVLNVAMSACLAHPPPRLVVLKSAQEAVPVMRAMGMVHALPRANVNVTPGTLPPGPANNAFYNVQTQGSHAPKAKAYVSL